MELDSTTKKEAAYVHNPEAKKKKKKSGKKVSKAEREARRFANLSLQSVEKISETGLHDLLTPLLANGKYDEAESKANEHTIDKLHDSSENNEVSRFSKLGFYSGAAYFLDLLSRNMVVNADEVDGNNPPPPMTAGTTSTSAAASASNATGTGSSSNTISEGGLLVSIRPRTLVHYAIRFSQKMVWNKCPNENAAPATAAVDDSHTNSSGVMDVDASSASSRANFSDLVSEILLEPLLSDACFECVFYLVSSFKGSDEILARYPLVKIAVQTLDFFNALGASCVTVSEEETQVGLNDGKMESTSPEEMVRENKYLSMMNSAAATGEEFAEACDGEQDEACDADDLSVDALSTSVVNSEAEINAEGERVVRRMISFDTDGKLRLELLQLYAFTGKYSTIARRCLSVLDLPISRPSLETLERVSTVSSYALLKHSVPGPPVFNLPSPVEMIRKEVERRLREKWGGGVQVCVFGSVAVDNEIPTAISQDHDALALDRINDIDMCLILPKECYSENDTSKVDNDAAAAAAAVGAAAVDDGGCGNEVDYRSSALALTECVGGLSCSIDPATVTLSKLYVVSRARVPVLKFNAKLPTSLQQVAESEASMIGGDADADTSRNATKKYTVGCDFIINNYSALVNSGMQRLAMESSEKVRVLWRAVKQWVQGRKLVGTHHGLLCSYAWRLLVIKFAQISGLCALWPTPDVLRTLRPNQSGNDMNGVSLKIMNNIPVITLISSVGANVMVGALDEEVGHKKRSRSPSCDDSVALEENLTAKAIKSEQTSSATPSDKVFTATSSSFSLSAGNSSSVTVAPTHTSIDVGTMMFDFFQWLCCGIDYKQGDIVALHSQSLSGHSLPSRGTHAWPRIRILDPVEFGRDLASHLTRKGFAKMLKECARGCFLLRDGLSLDVIAAKN